MSPTPCCRLGRRCALPVALRLLLALFGIAAESAFGAGQSIHTVQRGETLSSVARDFSVSIAELAERNGIKPSSHLTSGQKLKIPAAHSNAATRTRPAAGPISKSALPSSVQQAISSASVTTGRWKNIVIHHSGTSEGSAKGMNEYHLRVRHMEHGLAYHFVIGNGHGMGDGEVFVGDRWKKQLAGGHLASERQNEYCLGICLVGNFDKDQPTARQMKSLKSLIETLESRCHLTPDAVKTHQQINVIPTRCPGERFPTESFLQSLRPSESR